MKIDPSDDIWVADTGNHRIQRFGRDGIVRALYGKQGSGPDEFRSPTGLAVTTDKLFVADNGNGRIQVFSKN